MDLGNKLVHQWKCHGALIIAFDFDDTVSDFDKTFGNPALVGHVRNVLRRAKFLGHTLVCYTCRYKHNPELVEFLQAQDLYTDYINESPVKTDGKLFYNVFLDDKCGLREATDALEYALREIENIKLQEQQ